MVTSLVAARVPVVGESASLDSVPRSALMRVLVYDADLGSTQAVALARGRDVGLIATLRQPTGAKLHELAGQCIAAILLLDELTPDVLVDTVRWVSAGGTLLSKGLMRGLLDHVAHLNHSAADSLSRRERQVLEMLAAGEETRAIALSLNYSERTVKNVVHDVLTKLNCRTRAQAVGEALRTGIL
ncbi:hypothetical protein acdb102_22730 [Acidothermaceae bacterium B102]|nr:hypothetical protein acdb102_22730 [Acidothermaceae bacterium B102]